MKSDKDGYVGKQDSFNLFQPTDWTKSETWKSPPK
jgi:hypothetical protein